MIRAAITVGFSFAATVLAAAPDDVARAAMSADVVVIGEVHDNPHHHRTQADLVAVLQPRALVFEMLTADQASRITPGLIADVAALERVLDWSAAGWPDFTLYYPIFAAAPNAAIVGAALPRAQARAAMAAGIADTFGEPAEDYGLTLPLPQPQQAAREALQAAAHCNALPDNLLPEMVALQRLRDAMLARAVVQALEAAGAPVVVITGNGHARRDWGVPAVLASVASGVTVFAIAQGEDGAEPQGGFDAVIDAPSVQRPDPCAAFR